MNQTKTQKLSTLILAAISATILLNLGMPGFTAYADGRCPDPFGELSATPLVCQTKTPNAQADGKAIACPGGFSEDKAATKSAGDKLTCKQIPKSASDPTDLLKQASFLQGIQKFFNKLLWPLLVLIGGLIDNSLLFGNGMEERLRDIWIPIRNLVNILFVLALVGIALYNVLGIGDENSTYSLKAILPKLVIGIIAVNFSFLGIKVVLDGINVLTVSIFALPDQVSEGLGTVIEGTQGTEAGMIKRFCQSIRGSSDDKNDEQLKTEDENRIYNILAQNGKYVWKTDPKTKKPLPPPENSSKDTILAALDDQGNNSQQKTTFTNAATNMLKKAVCEGNQLTAAAKQYFEKWSSNNAAMAMAINMGKIVQYKDISADSLSKDLQNLVVNSLFTVVLYIIYAASFIALFVVLLGRIIVMWISIALSPILILMLAVPEIKDKVGGLGKFADHFTKNAIAPLIIATAMTVGWIMLQAIGSLGGEDSSIVPIGGDMGFPIPGLTTLQDLMVAIGTIGVIWAGVFGAAEGTIAEGVVGGIGSFLKDAGKFVGQLPFKHLPAIPITLSDGAGGTTTHKASIGELLQTGRDLITDKRQEGLNEFLGLNKTHFDHRDIPKIDSGEKLLHHLANAKDLTDQNSITKLKGIDVPSHKNNAAYSQLNDQTKTALKTFLTAVEKGDEKGKKAALAELRKDQNILDQVGKEAPGKSSTPATSSTPPPSVTPLAADTGISASKKLEDKYTDIQDPAAKKELIDRELPEIDKQLSNLVEVTKTGDTTKADATKSILAKIVFNNKTKAINHQDLRAIVGPAEYSNIQKVLGGGAAADTAIDAALNSGVLPGPTSENSATPPKAPTGAESPATPQLASNVSTPTPLNSQTPPPGSINPAPENPQPDEPPTSVA